ncbi:MAG: M24 family metallopeptidase [Halofilum sp. (in: g-proteobacteria)]|nr:M24 family metallopeptidase [Halofilum sp. (in: g-proteobacteria)]
MLAFTEKEYRERIRKARESMQADGIDVLLCSNPANMCYLTGYDGWSFYVHQLVLLTQDGDPLWIGRGMDAAAARVTTFMPHENIIAYGDDYVHSKVKHPLEFVADIIQQQGLEGATVGVEMDTFYFPARSLLALQRKLPKANIVDATTLVPWIKIVKSPAEIEYIQRAARICEHAMQTAVDHIEPGTRQCDAAAAIFQAQISGTEQFGGDYTSIVPMLPSGEGTNTPHLTWNDGPFNKGEATIIEIAGCYRRYHCPMARTVQLGKPPKRLADTAAVVVEGLEAAMDAARPGNTAEQVERAWRDTIERHGIKKDSRIGYSTGLNYPPDWGEGTISLRPGDKTELQENMVLHVIPGIWQEDWGVEISECIHVTANGGQALADFRRELIVKD